VIATSLSNEASGNLVEAYLHLGRAVPGSRQRQTAAYLSCESELAHPIGNFAALLDLDIWSARELKEVAWSRPAYSVYVTPGDQPENIADLLKKADFDLSYRLTQMIAPITEGLSLTGPELEPKIAEGPDERRQVADFMVEQFFTRRNTEFRKRIAMATAGANDLALYSVEDKGRIAAAVMLCHSRGMLGVYNLCVASNRRGWGIGSALLNWTLSVARLEGCSTTLQCDRSLLAWYSYRGFCPSGAVDVYSLAKR